MVYPFAFWGIVCENIYMKIVKNTKVSQKYEQDHDLNLSEWAYRRALKTVYVITN
jgi:hypothetical protein